MRIIINIDEARDADKKRAIRVRTGYTVNRDDSLRVMNCGADIYNILCEGFGHLSGGMVIHEGERR